MDDILELLGTTSEPYFQAQIIDSLEEVGKV